MLETFAHFVPGGHLYGHTLVPPIGAWSYTRMMNPERRPYRTREGYIGAACMSIVTGGAPADVARFQGTEQPDRVN